MQRPLALIFDLDNTLYEYDPCHEAALDAVTDIGVSAKLARSGDEFRTMYVQARSEVKSLLGEVAASHHRFFYFQRIVERGFKRIAPALVLTLYQAYWDTFIKRMRLDDGVLELLTVCRSRSMPLAIVSDMTADIQHRKLIKLGIDDLFDAIVTSEEAGVEKPNPKLLQYAMQRILAKLDKTTWMIGDSPVRDLTMARDAGITAVWRRRTRAQLPIGIQADAVFSTFAELGQMIEG